MEECRISFDQTSSHSFILMGDFFLSHTAAPPHSLPTHVHLQAIGDALTMSEEERRERHRQNYMHVQTHTAQVSEWRGHERVDEWRI